MTLSFMTKCARLGSIPTRLKHFSWVWEWVGYRRREHGRPLAQRQQRREDQYLYEGVLRTPVFRLTVFLFCGCAPTPAVPLIQLMFTIFGSVSAQRLHRIDFGGSSRRHPYGEQRNRAENDWRRYEDRWIPRFDTKKEV